MPVTTTLTYDNHDFGDEDVTIGNGGSSNTNPNGWVVTETGASGVGVKDGDSSSGVDAVGTVKGVGGSIFAAGTFSSLGNVSDEGFDADLTHISTQITLSRASDLQDSNFIRLFADIDGDGVADSNEIIATFAIGISNTNLADDVTFASGSDTTGFGLSTAGANTEVTRNYTLDLTGISASQRALWADHGIGIEFRSNSGSGEYAVHSIGAQMVVCFAAETQIQTPEGLREIQDLKAGDLVKTAQNGEQPILWIGSRKLSAADLRANPKLRPVRILAGALGGGLPKHDLLVSRQHRMQISSKIAERMIGHRDVLVPAIKLTAMPGIFVDDTVESVEYFHMLFGQHEVVFAEGAPAESLFTGPEALKAVSEDARIEILTLMPELERLELAPKPALAIPGLKAQNRLLSRHAKNKKVLLTDY